mgnify:FL=1
MSKIEDCRLSLSIDVKKTEVKKAEKLFLSFPLRGAGNHPGHDEDHDGGLLVAPVKPALKRPAMYQVVLLNDDYTPMDFVIEVLLMFFSMNEEKATQIMMTVHTQGKAICGVFTRDIAETKVALVNQYSADCEHPLMCEMQKVD